ncbi:MAG: lipid A deacylase LpxR family protein [Bacteroidota bacterium]|nr:lipid A deacylase LpxR family protein [Bacteroidota bacterium]
MAELFIRNSFTFLIILLLSCFKCDAQANHPNTFSKQLSVLTENDYYLFQGKDGYYTNGLVFTYSLVHHAKKSTIIKQVNTFELGQKLFTGYSRKIYNVSEIDRPVTGYLYAKFSQSDFVSHNQLWQWGASLGVIGKASLGEGMQDAFHRLIHVNVNYWGWVWDYQLKSEPGINVHGRYAIGLLNNSFLQLTPVSQATLGTGFTNISQGMLIQLGKFNPLHQSAYWNGSLQYKEDKSPLRPELFFYYYPCLMYQIYNATVQGGMFRKDKGPITSPVEPFLVSQQVGAMATYKRFTLRLATTFEGKEATSQRFTHAYGSIYGSYRFN